MDADTPTRSRLPWPAVAAATVLALLAALTVILVMGGDGEATEAPVSEGSFELTPVDGSAPSDPLQVPLEWPAQDAERALADDLEGPAVVNFFASWCSPCIAEMPDFEEVFRQAEGRVDFVGVAVSDRTADAERIVDETGITYRWARDERGDLANAAKVTQMPATMFVDADGEVVAVHSGALDAGELRELIEDSLGVAISDG